jgi:predicted DNA repair protein MutK
MPSGLFALLDDVAMIAKLASASVDDVTAAAGRAGMKAAGVVIDDTAVTPRYVHGLTPDRELPIIGKITLGSLRNKLLFLLPGALLLSAFAPFLIIPLLMLGGAYLAFEATEKIVEALLHEHHEHAEDIVESDAADLEKKQVKGAVRTDLILSAEIMAISLASIEATSFWTRAAALAVVAIAVTLGVYGAVAVIVKLDDIGLHLAQRSNATARKIGHGLVHAVPKLLKGLSIVGIAAMLWVGGGILLHGFEELHVTPLPEMIHHAIVEAANGSAMAEWSLTALAGAILGLIIGGILVTIVRRFTSHPEDLVVDA